MFKPSHLKSLAAAASLLLAGAAQAAIIGFDGGTVTRNDSSTTTSSNSTLVDNVKSYEEGGFKIEFFFVGTPTAFSSNIGDYYGVGNAVIHTHWDTGDFGQVSTIKITKIDGAAFDMNYFVLTSNTDTGGAPASGLERASIHASSDGVTDDYSQLLPSEDWGFPATAVLLGSQFDSVKAVWFDVSNAVDCFGMDNFYINQDAPGGVPEPGSLALAALALAGAAAARRRRAR